MESMSKVRMSPRPTCGRRIVAGKRPRPDDSKNCVRKLLKREISRAGNWSFNRTNSQEKFRNFHLQVGCERLCRICVGNRSSLPGHKRLRGCFLR